MYIKMEMIMKSSICALVVLKSEEPPRSHLPCAADTVLIQTHRNWLLRNPQIKPGMKGTCISRMLAGWDSGCLQVKTWVNWIQVAKVVISFSCSYSCSSFSAEAQSFLLRGATVFKPTLRIRLQSQASLLPTLHSCPASKLNPWHFAAVNSMHASLPSENSVILFLWGMLQLTMDLAAVSIYYVGSQSTKSAIYRPSDNPWACQAHRGSRHRTHSLVATKQSDACRECTEHENQICDSVKVSTNNACKNMKNSWHPLPIRQCLIDSNSVYESTLEDATLKAS